jgi:hypothetical protein
MVTLHPTPAPEQDPPHPSKTEPLAALAVRVTPVPVTKGALHEATLQLIPAGLEVTRPDPETETVSGE